ncbi:MAG: DHHW family protein [Clostridiales bacterium]
MKKPLSQYFLTIAFCGILAVVLLLFFILPKGNFSQEERRVLAEKPNLTLGNVLDGSFEKATDTYLSDHFPGRKTMVGLYNYYLTYSGRNGENGIYRAKNGYLINIPNKDNEKISQNIKTINTFSDANKINTTMMIVPSTGSVLSEDLPKNHLKYEDKALLEQIKKEKNPNINFTDLMPIFAQEKNQQLYFKTDHHWTTNGAYLGYLKYCQDQNLKPVKKENLTKEKFTNFYGTSYAKSGLWVKEPDTLELWKTKEKPTVEISEDNEKNVKKYTSLYFPEAFFGEDPYNIFLNGNHSLVKITNNHAENGKLLILKDSFANGFVPFLTHNYKEIYMVDLRYFRKSAVSDLIKTHDISEMLVLYSLDQFANDYNIMWLK